MVMVHIIQRWGEGLILLFQYTLGSGIAPSLDGSKTMFMTLYIAPGIGVLDHMLKKTENSRIVRQ